MDFSLSLSDEDFTIDMAEEYNKEVTKEQLFNQKRIAVILYNLPNMEADASECYLSPGHGPTPAQALVDTSSSVNILLLAILTAAGILTTKVVKSQISINRFGNSSEETMGYIEIDLRISPIRSFTKLYVININMAYHALLEKP
ncbi:hypothetical protein D8674_021249 [Pyrus ussuriensis x Pyrus communis]|uniref:Uncharacterized protein n=1 Tax=Pyrus ussuriensis x Pyrus communis TaxID=2448454 RepID=A0A5N5GLD5_9ROSA|nr:hypothetical protein D8674_021249 [Pyrus ussuriensis x Pyrus communis]